MGIDDEDIPEAQLLTLPETALPQGGLARLWAIRANALHDRDFNELLRELTGASSRHLMITAEHDPQEKEKRAERHRREQLAVDEQRRELADRQDRLLAQIEERQIEIEKRRQEIEDNALRLQDGRRVYVDGDRYRDGQGRVLTGADEAEADRQHQYNPNASTWQQKQDADREVQEARQLKDRILKGENGTDTPEQASQKLSGYEREYHDKLEQRAAQAPTDFGSADYMAEMSDEYTLSTVPAFTKAADPTPTAERRDTENETSKTQNTPRPGGQGALKL